MERTKHNVQKLKTAFRKNGLSYTLVQRNNTVAMFGVSGTFTNQILHFEVCKIKLVPAGEMFGKSFPAHETIPGNEMFGKEGSAAIVQRNEADKYFEELTNRINSQKQAFKGYKSRKTIESNTNI